jgi:hypothetical protein
MKRRESTRTSGQYFYKCRPTIPSRLAQDDPSALLLWQGSEALANVKQ